MPDLEMLLRDVRPVPDGAWADKLDARVAARFPGPPPRWQAALTALRQHFIALSAVGAIASVLIVLIAVGVHSSSDDMASDSGGSSASSETAAAPDATA